MRCWMFLELSELFLEWICELNQTGSGGSAEVARMMEGPFCKGFQQSEIWVGSEPE